MFTTTPNDVVLVTGASSGIGRALCLKLAKLKCRIALIARREKELVSLAQEVESLGGFGLPVVCDIADPESVARAYTIVRNELGDVTAAFLNAGIGSAVIGQNAQSAETVRVMSVNYFGMVYWLDHLLPSMQKTNKGLIVTISSLASYRGLPASGSYSASKAAVTTLFESYQIDFLATNIRFVNVSPYFVASEMSGVADDDARGIWSSSGKAASEIINGIENGKTYIAFPWVFRFFMYFLRILPVSIYRLFWKLAKRGG